MHKFKLFLKTVCLASSFKLQAMGLLSGICALAGQAADGKGMEVKICKQTRAYILRKQNIVEVRVIKGVCRKFRPCLSCYKDTQYRCNLCLIAPCCSDHCEQQDFLEHYSECKKDC